MEETRSLDLASEFTSSDVEQPTTQEPMCKPIMNILAYSMRKAINHSRAHMQTCHKYFNILEADLPSEITSMNKVSSINLELLIDMFPRLADSTRRDGEFVERILINAWVAFPKGYPANDQAQVTSFLGIT